MPADINKLIEETVERLRWQAMLAPKAIRSELRALAAKILEMAEDISIGCDHHSAEERAESFGAACCGYDIREDIRKVAARLKKETKP